MALHPTRQFRRAIDDDGQTIFPFKSALLEPAARQTQPLWLGLIQYELADGEARQEVCWNAGKFFPHAINLLSKRAIRASVRFAQVRNASADRKELARQLHAEIMQLKS
jgi:hypothetical protein